MNSMFLGVAVLIGLVVLMQGFVSVNPARLALGLRRAGAAALMAFAL